MLPAGAAAEAAGGAGGVDRGRVLRGVRTLQLEGLLYLQDAKADRSVAPPRCPAAPPPPPPGRPCSLAEPNRAGTSL